MSKARHDADHQREVRLLHQARATAVADHAGAQAHDHGFFRPTHGKGVKIDVVMTAHLRCSPTAANSLRKTIDKALALLEQEQQQVAESAQGSKPN